MFLEVLVEGGADAPVVQEVLQRKFHLVESESFRIHPHKGKGSLPANPLARPDPRHRGLLDQLPAKLRGYAHLPAGYCVIVLVDADNMDCVQLKRALVSLYNGLDRKPICVLFRIAVEETESWFLADGSAIKAGYPRARLQKLPAVPPDSVIGAWERLAEVLGLHPADCDGADKHEWAIAISPHLDFDDPKSPSLRAFINGVARISA